MTDTVDEIEELTERVIGCAIEVHRTLGPGLLESIYQECLIIELKLSRVCASRPTVAWVSITRGIELEVL